LFIAASLYYLFLTTVWSFIQSRIEARLGERKAATQGPSMVERFLGGLVKGGH
jgi:hypothetical protein